MPNRNRRNITARPRLGANDFKCPYCGELLRLKLNYTTYAKIVAVGAGATSEKCENGHTVDVTFEKWNPTIENPDLSFS